MKTDPEDEAERETTEGAEPEEERDSRTAETVPNRESDELTDASPDEVTRVLSRDGEGRVLGDSDVPHRLGDYELRERLGSGAMGQVYRAVSQRTGSMVAIKLASTDGRPEFVAALREEVRGLASVNVPNVPTVIDRGEELGYVWMAQEWIDGTDLRELIGKRRKGELSFYLDLEGERETGSAPRELLGPASDIAAIREYVGWFRDLARALAAVHAAGLVHRDIKPANIMLWQKKTPYLIDFGLALHRGDAAQRPGDLVGTVPYMSPEQAGLGFGVIDAKSDIYSLGVTFHELVTGERVVCGGDRAAMLEEIQTHSVPAPSRVNAAVPRSLDAIFARALAKRPEDRHPDAGALADDLDEWLQPSSLAGRVRRLLADRRSLVLTIGAVLIVALVASLVLLHDPQAEDRARLVEAARTVRSEEWNAAGLMSETYAWAAESGQDADWAGSLQADIERFVEASALMRTAEMIAAVSLVLRTPGEPLRYEEIAAESARLIAAGVDHPELHLHVAFARFMSSAASDAEILAEIDRGLARNGSRSARRRLQRLRWALLLRAGSMVEARELNEKLLEGSGGFGGLELPAIETCLEAVGVFFAREDLADAGRRLEDLIDRMKPMVGTALEPVARSMSARMLLELGEPEAALVHLDRLSDDLRAADDDIATARRQGIRAFRAWALVELALIDASRERDALEAVELLLGERSSAFDWLAARLLALQVQGRDQVLSPAADEVFGSVLGRAFPVLAEHPDVIGVETWRFIKKCSDRIGTEADVARAIEFAASLDRLAIPAAETDARRLWRKTQENLLWSFIKRLHALTDGRSDGPVDLAALNSLGDTALDFARGRPEALDRVPLRVVFVAYVDAYRISGSKADGEARAEVLRRLEESLQNARALEDEDRDTGIILERIEDWISRLEDEPSGR